MINKVILIGNLGQDPEIRHLDTGVAVGKFSLATNENYQDKAGEWHTITEWHNIVVWRHLAERAEKNLHKGMQVYVEGKLKTRKWTDQEGKDRYTTDIVANTFRILGKKERADSGFSGSFPGGEDEEFANRGAEELPADNIPAEKGNKPVDDTENKVDDLPF